MNSTYKNLFKNMSYSFWANCFALFISVFNMIIIPKVMSLADFGNWQLFVFYTSFVEVLNIGWGFGLYLRNGGKYYKDLDFSIIRGQFWLMLAFDFVVACIVFGSMQFYLGVSSFADFYIFLGIFFIIFMQKYFLINIIQAIGRIKLYAFMLIVENCVYFVGAIILILISQISYFSLIKIYIASQIFSLMAGAFFSKKIIIGKIDRSNLIRESKQNITVGYKVMLASITSILIIGVIRLGIQMTWDIETFAEISLTLSISNMLVKFVNAIAIPLFPLLRRIEFEEMKASYKKIYRYLMTTIYGLLIFYYPVSRIIILWLPQYEMSIQYSALLLPICIFESKMALLINTFMKALRMEKKLMFCNLLALFVSVITTFISVFIFKSLIVALISIVVILAFRSTIAELILSKKLNIDCKNSILIECVITISFMLISWNLSYLGTILYAILYVIIMLILKKRELNLSKTM